MNILHLSTYDHIGGAAKAAYRQHSALLEAGVDSQMRVRFKTTTDPTIHFWEPNNNYFQKAGRALRRQFLHHKGKSLTQVVGGDLSDDRGDIRSGFSEAFCEADLINVHQIDSFLDLTALFNAIPESIPIVVTMHSMYMFTGGCHYAKTCRRFEAFCGACPRLNSHRERDFTRQAWNRRRDVYDQRSRRNLAFVANSDWLADEAKRSFLLKGKRIEKIHLGIDKTVFVPELRTDCRQALGLPATDPVIMFSAGMLHQPEKGLSFLVDALHRLSPVGWTLITAGTGDPPKLPPGVKYSGFGSVSDDRLMSILYRAADLFIMPSLNETFGQTALEAAASGTPVVGFATGGVPEIVTNGINGELVPTGDTDALASTIAGTLENTSMRDQWPHEARSWLKANFCYRINAERYTNLYREMLAN